ncbi:NAD-dependent epimerase [Methylobacterium aerolatum]|uniref:UDP-glucuronate 4-epimerase n=1 Tax=Methylobacterium aerolatum TaxID=418708 RepID=A0ABU0HTR0_9HYPH|nr:NAD-dependent epimerase [Methylobacterium aerolatum]MDQ0445717.1 UDP-glucuronate 4-epimerase [Methylobacterium aerolatum]GJD36173.1 UDP-N-acetylglucosamine 4-epimerase [Methylobacterium aerolatum]
MTAPRILVTGAAGFIGFHVAQRLLREGRAVTGLDNVNAYYDPALKEARLAQLGGPGYAFHRIDLCDGPALDAVFREGRFACVVHLAAQAGVRYSITDPQAYAASNLTGFLHVLEGCRRHGVGHLIYASSSSVYGAVTAKPFSIHQNVDHPVSLYAATKKANELMAHSYSHLYRLPTTGLRFFTVYGPWGRPDMALWLFTRAILAGEPIDVFNGGRMRRDFTYVDDVVEAIGRLIDRPAAADPAWSGDAPDPGTSSAPYRLYNIGNSEPVELTEMVAILEEKLGRRAEKNILPMQPGDVPETFADVADLARDVGFSPRTSLADGIGRFVDWYRAYHRA